MILAFIFTLILSGSFYANNNLDVLITKEPSTDQFNVGIMYYSGDGVTRDYKEAVKWFKLAAERGDILAQFYLGSMYDRGEGVERDFKEAVKWYQLAAEQGVAGAKQSLGIMYLNGLGVIQDKSKAKQLFKDACANGYAYGCENYQMLD